MQEKGGVLSCKGKRAGVVQGDVGPLFGSFSLGKMQKKEPYAKIRIVPLSPAKTGEKAEFTLRC
uniref:Uncharacterized protein n=1 Tax=Candidatus Kentrum sp. DK TaxID=2126562 RepID=A0A450SIL3_9GAMM|nr:MAG: hypothetical protein BECKDK2373C_GA0170839_10393 [Candidatus Kentron sp. DK]VFJ59722.1 MAG: hypothetical protein BECKDK2373B_GA0170837_108517 [Candidatus Kentron sp. DK]